MGIRKMSVEEAARLIKDGDIIGVSGFTPVGSPKAVSVALAEYAKEEQAKGNPFKIGVIAGASLDERVDGALAQANAISFRTPYQSSIHLRKAINNEELDFFDMHLSSMAQEVHGGFYGNIDVAIIEAVEVTEGGQVVPTCGVGLVSTVVNIAKTVIVELNSWHPKELRGLHDLVELERPPFREVIPIKSVSDRIGNVYNK